MCIDMRHFIPGGVSQVSKGEQQHFKQTNIVTMCIDMCVETCADMRTNMRADMCTDACTDVRLDMCMDACVDICPDLCIDMQIDIWQFIPGGVWRASKGEQHNFKQTNTVSEVSRHVTCV